MVYNCSSAAPLYAVLSRISGKKADIAILAAAPFEVKIYPNMLKHIYCIVYDNDLTLSS